MAALDTVIAQQGDTLDLLIWRERSLTAADLGAVLEANPGLAAAGATLPLGTVVAIPATPPAAETLPLVNLWD